MTTTSGVVSTVCYAEKSYLLARLGEWTKSGQIAFYAIIQHAERIDDKTGEVKKRHCHLVVQSAVERLNLQSLGKDLEQVDAENPVGKPLGLLPWSRTKPDLIDWLAYAIHDSLYLRYKRLVKAVTDYPLSEVSTTDETRIQSVFEAFPRRQWQSAVERIWQALADGKSLVEFLDDERVPMAQLGASIRAFREVEELFKRAEHDARYAAEVAEARDRMDDMPW